MIHQKTWILLHLSCCWILLSYGTLLNYGLLNRLSYGILLNFGLQILSCGSLLNYG